MTYLATSGSRSACISIGLTTRPGVLCTYPTTHPTMVAHSPHRVVHSSHHPCALTQTLTPPPLCSHLNMCTLPNTPDHGLRNHPTTHPTTVVHSPHYHSTHLGCALTPPLTPPMVVHHSPNHLCALTPFIEYLCQHLFSTTWRDEPWWLHNNHSASAFYMCATLNEWR